MKLTPAVRQARIAIASNAGGSSKTTMTIHLAYGFGVKGHTVTVAELQTLRCVFLTQEALDKLDHTALFDRQLTISIQAEELHPFDLANGLVKLMVLQHSELEDQLEEIPNSLSAAAQRLKRNDKATELALIRIADRDRQKAWLETAGLNSVEEQWIFSTILDKQLNPISISSKVFPLLNLPSDLQNLRETGLEGSKVLEGFS